MIFLHTVYQHPGHFRTNNDNDTKPYRLTVSIFTSSTLQSKRNKQKILKSIEKRHMILLTGYKGFIGSHFLKYLENEAERDVIGIDIDNAWDFMVNSMVGKMWT